MKNFREEELKHLEAFLRLGNVLIFQAFQGLGKKSLVKHLIRENQYRFSWNYSLPESQEQVNSLLKEKGDVDLFVWGPYRHISESLKQIISYLSIFASEKHLFLIDSEYAQRIESDVPVMKLKAFTQEKTLDYLRHFFPELEFDPKEAYEFSSGIPERINIFAQKDFYDFHSYVEGLDLTPIEKKILLLPIITERSISRGELDQCIPDEEKPISNIFQRLHEFSLVENCKNLNSSYTTSIFARELSGLWKQSPEYFDLIQYIFKTQLEVSPILKLKFSLLLKDMSLFASCLEKIDFYKMGKYSEEQMLWIAEHIKTYQTLPEFESPIQIRKLAFILFSGKNRSLATSYLASVLQKNRTPFGYDLDQAMVVVDYIKYLNRSGNTQKAYEVCERYEGVMNHSVLPMLLVEKGLSQASLNRQKAIKYYNEALTKNNYKVNLDKNTKRALKETLASAYFEKARVLIGLESFNEAKNSLIQAIQNFAELEMNYSTAMSKLNLAWVLLKMNQWQTLDDLIGELRTIAKKYSFTNVRAGAEIILATKHRHFFEYKEAFRALEKAKSLLTEESPSSTFIMLYSEQVRLFLQQDQMSLAQKFANKIFDIGIKDKNKITQQVGRNLLQLANCYEMDSVHFHEFVDSGLKDSEFDLYDLVFIYPLLNPQEKERSLNYFKASPLGKTKLLKENIESKISLQDQSIWDDIRQFNQVTSHCPEPSSEKVFIKLLEAELTKSTGNIKALLDDAKLELIRFSYQSEIKNFLEYWWNCLYQRENPLKQSFWQKTPFFIKNYFGKFFYEFYKDKTKVYSIRNYQGEYFADHSPSPESADLLLIAETNEVFVKAKARQRMLKKNSLVRLLSQILSLCPDPISKQAITKLVWDEDYDPTIHDSRIYTSIQRLREEIPIKNCILASEGSYRWNPSISFKLVKRTDSVRKRLQRTQSLIVNAFHEQQKELLSRKDLVDITASSDATIKRELSKLLELGIIKRRGQGRNTKYLLSRGSEEAKQNQST